MQLRKPNAFDVEWVYSVPCGQKGNKEGPCPSWIFVCAPEDIWDTHERKVWVHEYLKYRHWVAVLNTENKRFICPKCTNEEL